MADEWADILKSLGPEVATDPRAPNGPAMRRGDELSQPDPSPSGPLVSVQGVPLDVTAPSTRGIQALDQTNRNLRSVAGGLVAGGIGGKVASMLPGVSNLLGASSIGAQVAGGVLEGAGAGAASTAGSAVATDGALPTSRQLAEGAAVGGVLGGAGRAIEGALKGAPAREDANILGRAGEEMKAKPYERFFGSRDSVVKTLKEDPELRASLGNPDKLLPIIEQRMPVANGEAQKILATADAKNGPVPVSDWMSKAVGASKAEVARIGGTEKNPALTAVENVGEQFRSGIGKDPNNPPSAADVRAFMSQEIGGKINKRPVTADETAQNRAAAVLYANFSKVMNEHVANSSPFQAAQLQKLNDQQSTYIMLRDAAEESKVNASKGTSWQGKVLDLGHKGVGFGVGAAAGNAVGGPVGAAVGGAIGAKVVPPILRAGENAVQDAAEAATRAMATQAGQALGAAAPIATRAAANYATPKIVQKLDDKNQPSIARQIAPAAAAGDVAAIHKTLYQSIFGN